MQRVDQLLSQTNEEGLIVQRPTSTLSLAIFREAENQIDIGGKVKLAAAT